MKNMFKYWVVFATVSVALYFASLIVFDDFTYQSQSLADLWREDIAKLETEKILPLGLHNLREIEWVTPDATSQVWARFTSAPFSTKPSGEYRLELLVLSQEDTGSPLTAVIQHHLIHIDSGNSVWELGRTYKLPSP